MSIILSMFHHMYYKVIAIKFSTFLCLGGLCQNGRCINLPGSFRCECFEGFEPSQDYSKCIGTFTLTNVLYRIEHHYVNIM